MIRQLILIVAFALPAAAACIPLAGDRILGRDLALANPAFSALPPQMTIGYAPPPGARRIFAVAELGRIARANRISPEGLMEICFEIPLRSLTPEEVRETMIRSLPEGSELEIIDLPKASVPAGRLEFPLAALEPAPPAAKGERVWRGSLHYGQTLRMAISVRVRVQRKYVAVIAGKDLPLNVPIEHDSLRMETVLVPLDSERLALRIEDVLGRAPKKAVRAGEAIPLGILSLPPLVHRGDAVKVEVHSGPARLAFDAVSQSTACAGDMIELRNPDSGRTFRARLEANGRAVLVVASREAL